MHGHANRQHREGPFTLVVLMVIGAFVVFTLAVGLALRVTQGPAIGGNEPVYGVVSGVGLAETWTGSYPVASVTVDGREGAFQLPRSMVCLRGESIQLVRRRTTRGAYQYSLGPRGCIAPLAPTRPLR
jgi:hypothetical protein